MAKQQLRTFKDIVEAVREQLKIQSQDTESLRRIRRNINTIYLDEVVAFKDWEWKRGGRQIQTAPYFGAGTANLVQNSTTVTLTQAPPTSVTGYYFAAADGAQPYTIAAHAAGSLTLELETPYSEATNAGAGVRIWTDRLALPADCDEVIEITHAYRKLPVENVGLQEYRRIVATQPRAEGRPQYYSTAPVADPEPFQSIPGFPTAVSRSSNGLIKSITFNANITSFLAPGDSILANTSGDYSYNIPATVSAVDGATLYYTGMVAFTEASTPDVSSTVQIRSNQSYEAVKSLLVYPSLSNVRTSMQVDYVKLVEPLEDDSDEPIVPLNDRIVLFYGAMWMSCDRERNPEWAAQNYQLFQAKLARMAGKMGDSPDKPIMKPSNLYLMGKRVGSRRSPSGGVDPFSSSWAGGSSTPTGLANSVAIFNDAGELVGSTTISVEALEYLIGAEGGLTASIPASTSNQVINEWSATTYKGAFVSYSIIRDTEHAAGSVVISTNGSQAACMDGPYAGSLGSLGVTFTADVNAGNIRLLATSDGSGSTTAMSYKVQLV